VLFGAIFKKFCHFLTHLYIYKSRTHIHTHLEAKLACQIRVTATEFRTFLQMTDLKFQTLGAKLEQKLSRLYNGRQKAPGKKPLDNKRQGKRTSLETLCQKYRVTGG
jgi:hypothetical protein